MLGPVKLALLLPLLLSPAMGQHTTFGGLLGGGGGSGPQSPLPTPPGNACQFVAMQNQTGNPGTWNTCNNNTGCGAGGGSTNGSSSIAFNNNSFTHDGNTSTQIISTNFDNTQFWDTLWYRNLGSAGKVCSTMAVSSITNVLYDRWVYPVGNVATDAFEYFAHVFVGNAFQYRPSFQCNGPNSEWRVFDATGHQWVEPNNIVYPCNWAANGAGANQWHHMQYYATLDQTAHTYTFNVFVVDGVTIWNNPSPALTFTAAGGSGNNVTSGIQLDGFPSSNGVSTEYWTEDTLVVW